MTLARLNPLLLVAWLAMSAPYAASAGTIVGRVRVQGTTTDLSSFVLSVEDIEGYFPVPAQHASIDQKQLRFMPHVLPILVGTTVEFPNSDPLLHNVFSISETKRFNLGLYGRGTVRRITFDKPGVVELLCNVHLEMSGFIVVLKNPYFARTDPDGSFRIGEVPPGPHRVRCWHERLPAQERTVNVPSTGSVHMDFIMEGTI